ncbi:Methyl-accepting chemotaxis protein McpS [Marinomonas spartinae]|uniref:Methyl-accepting chemotaxis protein McpS n=1 Tax=Marinomonas spartinae TaxID=1792290 RepID=A0A1A8TTG3_9GAMM|nr:methyl-accepting chemotaxis protein [Marinomonas spartinae]SBS31706.1 Methyl-accepting chemotaxis protein McpS [Marinomonas spartinae]SBS36343.1 Methyl-accepting chemotaxis protein McpS [Marinomonas spartinae]
MSLSVIQRILVGFGGLLALLLIVATAGFIGLEKVESGLEQATGNIANINKISNQINQNLAKADTTVLQYLLSRSPKTLKQLKTSFEDSKKKIQTLFNSTSEQVQDYPNLVNILKQSKVEVAAFYQFTDMAFKNHERMLKLQAKIPDGKFDLKDDISYLLDNLNTIKKNHPNEQKGFAASYLIDQFESLKASISDYFDSTNLKNMLALKQTMAKNFSSMGQNLTYLDDSDSSDSVKQVKQEVLGDDSVVENYYHFISLDQQSESIASKLVDKMDVISGLSKQTIDMTEQLREAAKDSAKQAAYFSKLFMAVVVLVSVLIAVLITLWVSRSIRKPLASVMLVLGKISDGDFTQRSQVSSKDEFGELSRWVNQLVTKLQSVMQDVNKAANDVADSAERNVRIASETKMLMNTQSDRSSNIATAMTEMLATVQDVAKNAEITLNQVQEVDTLAVESRNNMSSNIHEVEQLVAQLESSEGVVNELDEHSKNIGKILEVIQDIAEQTNLLALNAAIEAARAGEQGRGFAVVADEVRSLANRTHTSTEEIQSVISLLQGGVSKTVAAMQESKDKAYSSVKETRMVGEALDTLQTRMVEVRDLSTQIATAAEQQSLVAQDINKSVHEISAMSEEATKSADLSEKDSEQLFDLSSNTKQLLAQFKIEP